MHRLAPIRVLCIAGAAFFLSGRAHADPEATEILLRSLQPLDTTYVGRQVSHMSGGPGGRRFEQHQEVFRSGDRLLIRYRDGRIMFDDGKESLFYRPGRREVERGPSSLGRAGTAQRRRQLRARRAAVSLLPEDSVAGRPAYVVSVQPANGAQRKLWVDRETYLLLRHDETTPAGIQKSTYFTSIDLNATPSPGDVEFRIPPGVRVVEQGRRPIRLQQATQMAEAWGGLLRPGYLPAGYQLRGYFRHQFRGRRMLAAMYGVPGKESVLTVFQGPSQGVGSMRRHKDRLNVVAVTRGKADVVVVGELPEAELRRVMVSLSPQ